MLFDPAPGVAPFLHTGWRPVDSDPTGRYLSFTLYIAKGKQASAFSGRLVFANGRRVQIERGSYTVRLWVEPDGQLARGTIRQAETGQSIHFQSSGRLVEFIRRGLVPPEVSAKAMPDRLLTQGVEHSRSIVIDATILIPDGPEIALSRRVTVDAFDKMDVTVNAGATDLEVELLPEAPPGQVRFLLVASDQYGEHLSYKVNDRASTEVYRLDQPHLLFGAGAADMLAPAPDSLFFTNRSLEQDAQVNILIGRDATQPHSPNEGT